MRGLRGPGRVAGFVATFAATALVMTGCAASGGDTADLELSDEPVTLSFTWWGNDTRTAQTQEVIAAFEAANPTITIEPQFTDWAGYWDKLATETAANDAPDIIQMDEKYIATYGGRGALLDMATLDGAVDTSKIPDTVLDAGKVEESLYGVPVGLDGYAFIANPNIFEQYGVEIPDDSTWTWDDLADTAAAISAAGGGIGVTA